MTRYEIVRDLPSGLEDKGVQRHPEQPEDGFASATEAALWCEETPRYLGGDWYIRAMGRTNG